MSGRNRIIVAQITERDLRGEALKEALYKEMCKDEKSSSYEREGIKNDKRIQK